MIPDRVLVLYPSDIHTYDVKTGPLQPVRQVIYVDGAWSLQFPIFEHTVITSGELPTLETSQVIELGKGLVHANHTLCPGLLEDFTSLGYVPENVRVMGGPVRNAHAKSCIITHIPSHNIPSKRESADPRLKCFCAECQELPRYIKKQMKSRRMWMKQHKWNGRFRTAIFPGNFCHQVVKPSVQETFSSQDRGP